MNGRSTVQCVCESTPSVSFLKFQNLVWMRWSDDDSNMLLLLPPSVGSGGEQRLCRTAVLHEQILKADPQQEECQEIETKGRWETTNQVSVACTL